MDIKKLQQAIKNEVNEIREDVYWRLADMSKNVKNIVQGYESEFEEITKKEKEIEKTETKEKIEFAKHLLSKQGY